MTNTPHRLVPRPATAALLALAWVGAPARVAPAQVGSSQPAPAQPAPAQPAKGPSSSSQPAPGPRAPQDAESRRAEADATAPRPAAGLGGPDGADPRRAGDPEASGLRLVPRASPVVEPPVPGLTGGVDWMRTTDWLAGLERAELEWPTPDLLAERSFLGRRPGVLLPGPSGTVIYVPGPEALSHPPAYSDPARSERAGVLPPPAPMLLMPCAVTERIEASLVGRERMHAELSGQVFIYHGRNYVIPTAYTPTATTSPASASTQDHSDQPAPIASQPVIADPAGADGLDERIAALRAARGPGGGGVQADPVVIFTPTPTDPPSAPAANPNNPAAPSRGNPAASGPGPVTPLAGVPSFRDGELMPRRRGRVERLTDGRWAFAVDSDADNAPANQPRMVLLPCRLMMAFEEAARFNGATVAAEVGGRVYVHRGTVYLLPVIINSLDINEISQIAPIQ